MKHIRKMILSVLCMIAVCSATAVCLYEVYNSYLSADPKNIVTYHAAATQKDADFSIPLPEEKATEDVATFSDAYALSTPDYADPVKDRLSKDINKSKK